VRVAVFSRVTDLHGAGGMQTHLTLLCAALAAAGHEVEVITTACTADPGRGVGGARVHALGGTRPGRHGTAWRRASVACFAELDRVRPFAVVVSEDGGGWGYVRERAHGRMRAPIVMFRHATTLMNLAVSRRLREPFDVLRIAHNLYYLLAWLRRYGEAVDRYVAINDEVAASTCRETGVAPSRVAVVENGVDTDLFRPRSDRAPLRRAYGLPESAFVLLWAGRLVAGKGWEVAIDALAALVRGGARSVRLLIAGPAAPEQVARLRADVHRRGLTRTVVDLGALPHAEMPAVYGAADALLMPTTFADGTPYVALEGLSCGVPIVAFAGTAVARLLGNGAHGIVVDRGEGAGGIADAVVRLLCAGERREAMGRLGRRFVEATHSLGAQRARLVEAVCGVAQADGGEAAVAAAGGGRA
jgi:glycosyltransferase involved in cell wall biosynthesis